MNYYLKVEMRIKTASMGKPDGGKRLVKDNKKKIILFPTTFTFITKIKFKTLFQLPRTLLNLKISNAYLTLGHR
ncbi:CLUMA_CG018415, isoform A [Clunio marinus]|uniref:CLUMA_CG018415, isoform A n=1 Tax=Clunio marinus TaxID=568069 RepID=A0A1J1IZY7_9DIPT|nr:CLUMA_CG018415, isoform A [Clunio marinus]